MHGAAISHLKDNMVGTNVLILRLVFAFLVSSK